jgi:hypothetical protein
VWWVSERSKYITNVQGVRERIKVARSSKKDNLDMADIIKRELETLVPILESKGSDHDSHVWVEIADDGLIQVHGLPDSKKSRRTNRFRWSIEPDD